MSQLESIQLNPRREWLAYLLDCSTGAAGLIRMIQMFAQHFWAAAILGVVSTVGWTIQGLGNAYYYRQVNETTALKFLVPKVLVSRFTLTTPPRGTPWTRSALFPSRAHPVDFLLTLGQNRICFTWGQGLLYSWLKRLLVYIWLSSSCPYFMCVIMCSHLAQNYGLSRA
jgi:hypothetical protein